MKYSISYTLKLVLIIDISLSPFQPSFSDTIRFSSPIHHDESLSSIKDRTQVKPDLSRDDEDDLPWSSIGPSPSSSDLIRNDKLLTDSLLSCSTSRTLSRDNSLEETASSASDDEPVVKMEHSYSVSRALKKAGSDGDSIPPDSPLSMSNDGKK